jgi:hypothetical protein
MASSGRLPAGGSPAILDRDGEPRMTANGPRDIAVVDAGSTNTKTVLFDDTGPPAETGRPDGLTSR